MKTRRAKKVELCVYCGVNPATTRDHVVAKCLFDGPLPSNMVTVPACGSCNGEKAKNDDYLRDMLVVDYDCSEHPVAKALLKGKVTRALRRNRSELLRKALPEARVEPVRTPGGIYLPPRYSFPLDGERVNEIFRTVTRGLYYKIRQERLPDDYIFEVRRIYRNHIKDVWSEFQRLKANGPYGLGDVFGCLFLYGAEDPGVTCWLIWFYGGAFIMVSTDPPTASAEQAA